MTQSRDRIARGRAVAIVALLGSFCATTAALAQTPPAAPRQAPPPSASPPSASPPSASPAGKPLVQIVVRAQGTGDRFASTYSLLCEEGSLCTAIFDVARRRPAGATGTPPPPTRLEIGIWSRPDGEVMLVPATGATKLMLNCKPSQLIQTKGRSEAPRLRYSVHETDPGCSGATERAPPEKAVAAIEVVVRPATLVRGQRT